MNGTMIDNLFVLVVFAAEGVALAFVVFVVFAVIYMLFPRLRKEMKEDFNRKVKW